MCWFERRFKNAKPNSAVSLEEANDTKKNAYIFYINICSCASEWAERMRERDNATELVL